MLFGKPKTIQFTREELDYISESDRLNSSFQMNSVYTRRNYEYSSFSIANCIRMLGGSLTSKDRGIIDDLTALIKYSTGEFERSLERVKRILEIQGSSPEASLVEKYNRHQNSLNIGKGILKKLEKLK